MAARTLTFLMTDVQGSTRLWEEHPADMQAVVRRHEEILCQAVLRNDGTLIKSKGEGDSTFSVFESPTRAVRAAIESQDGLAKEPWPPGVSMKVRMSIHVGEAQMREDDYLAPAINRCARIREVGHGGQILTSNAVHTLVDSGSDLRWIDHGLHRLRDLLRPEHVWQVQAADKEEAFPKLKSLSVLRNNLPVQLTTFIGRRRELERLKSLIQHNRLVNVVGFGGEGKTRLVLQVAAEMDAEASTCVWFVPLESLRTKEEVTAAIVAVLGGEPETELSAANIEKLGLKTGSTILIFDNAEHLIRAIRPIVELLLREAPSLRILLSSREPMHYQGEVLFRITGLGVPPASDPSVEALERSEAGQLFLARASARTSDFRVTPTVAKPIGAICRLLNGVPLAIEQAAPLIAFVSPAQILSKLQTRLDWLASEDPSTPERHRTLNATIRWSYELLTENERRLFLMLGLFRGSFTMEAATYLAQSIVEDESEALRLFRGLVDKSLVSTLYDQDNDVRFKLSETLRQFAVSLFAGAGDQWMNRYVDWYVQFAQLADAAIYGPDQVRWLERCQAEEANMRKALEWCLDRADPRLLDLAFGFRKYWMRKGMFTEGRHWLREAYDIADLNTTPSAATMANVLGAFAFNQSDFAAALDLYQRSLEGSLVGNDQRALAAVYNNMAITLDSLGRLEEADQFHLYAIQASRSASENGMLSTSLLNHSITQMKLGRLKNAEASAYEALTMAETSQDMGSIAIIHSSLCSIAVEQKQMKEAATHAKDALLIWAQASSPHNLALLLLKVSRIAVSEQNPVQAVLLVGGARVLLESSGADRDPDAIVAAQTTLNLVAESLDPGEIRRCMLLGRSSSQDQLVVAATAICDGLLGPDY